MKKLLTLFLVTVMAAASLFTLVGCDDSQGVIYPPSDDPEDVIAKTYEKTYEDGYGGIDLPEYVTPFINGEDVTAFENMTLDFQKHQDTAIRRSIYYQTAASLDGVNYKDLPGYSIAALNKSEWSTDKKPHTVVYLDVAEDVISAGVQIKVTAQSSVTSAQILPERLNAETMVDGSEVVKFTVNQYRPYTLIVNGSYEKPLTVFVRKPEKVELPYGWTLFHVGPGVHFFDRSDVAKLFGSGNRTILYLEAGCLLVPTKTGEFHDMGSFFGYEKEATDLKIIGHGMIDVSKLGYHETLRAVSMANITNLEINGLTILNSCNWTMEIRGCNNVRIEDCIIFGYRTNSDGFCMTSSSNVWLENCFARSGDDLFEIKAASDNDIENVTFNNCIAWADACRCFGIIQETRSNIDNVTFSNCSVLYQLSHWPGTQALIDQDTGEIIKGVDTDDTYMAAWVIAAGERGNITNVTYDNCDINYSMAYAIGLAVGVNKETEIDFNGNYIDGLTFKNCSFYDRDGNRPEDGPEMYYGHVRFYNNSFDANGNAMADAIRNVTFENVYLNGTKITSSSQLSTRYWGNAGNYIYSNFVTFK